MQAILVRHDGSGEVHWRVNPNRVGNPTVDTLYQLRLLLPNSQCESIMTEEQKQAILTRLEQKKRKIMLGKILDEEQTFDTSKEFAEQIDNIKNYDHSMFLAIDYDEYYFLKS